MSDEKLVGVWVVGEISIPEEKIQELGVTEAAEEALGHTGFKIGYAEETNE